MDSWKCIMIITLTVTYINVPFEGCLEVAIIIFGQTIMASFFDFVKQDATATYLEMEPAVGLSVTVSRHDWFCVGSRLSRKERWAVNAASRLLLGQL